MDVTSSWERGWDLRGPLVLAAPGASCSLCGLWCPGGHGVGLHKRLQVPLAIANRAENLDVFGANAPIPPIDEGSGRLLEQRGGLVGGQESIQWFVTSSVLG